MNDADEIEDIRRPVLRSLWFQFHKWIGIILAIVLIPTALVIAAVTVGYAYYFLGRLRRHDQPHVYTEREVADSQRPLASGVVIVAPSQAPQNGSVSE